GAGECSVLVMETKYRGMNVPLTPLRFMERIANIFPKATACIAGERRISFRQFREDAAAFARAFRAHVLGLHDREGVLAPNSYEALLAQFAEPLAGGVTVPINTRLAAAEVAYIQGHAGFNVLIGAGDLLAGVVEELPEELR